jgi:hypothetical protein
MEMKHKGTWLIRLAEASRGADNSSGVRDYSGRVDGTAGCFDFYLCDAVVGDIHLLEPGGDGSRLWSLPNTVDLAFGEVGEALEAFDGRILLGSRHDLRELVAGDAFHRVGADEFCHDVFFGFVCCCFDPHPTDEIYERRSIEIRLTEGQWM